MITDHDLFYCPHACLSQLKKLKTLEDVEIEVEVILILICIARQGMSSLERVKGNRKYLLKRKQNTWILRKKRSFRVICRTFMKRTVWGQRQVTAEY